jgi:hypothetical protein
MTCCSLEHSAGYVVCAALISNQHRLVVSTSIRSLTSRVQPRSVLPDSFVFSSALRSRSLILMSLCLSSGFLALPFRLISIILCRASSCRSSETFFLSLSTYSTSSRIESNSSWFRASKISIFLSVSRSLACLNPMLYLLSWLCVSSACVVVFVVVMHQQVPQQELRSLVNDTKINGP